MNRILILAVVYGINSPFSFVSDQDMNSLKLLIAVILVAKFSFLLGHFIYYIFVPILKREFLYETGTTLITAALWIGAIWTPYPTKIVLLALGNIEIPVALLLATPYARNLLSRKVSRKRMALSVSLHDMRGSSSLFWVKVLLFFWLSLQLCLVCRHRLPHFVL